jgi:hypothetical protein
MRNPLVISAQGRTTPTHQTYAGRSRAVLDGRIAFQSPRVRLPAGRLGRCYDWSVQVHLAARVRGGRAGKPSAHFVAQRTFGDLVQLPRDAV